MKFSIYIYLGLLAIFQGNCRKIENDPLKCEHIERIRADGAKLPVAIIETTENIKKSDRIDGYLRIYDLSETENSDCRGKLLHSDHIKIKMRGQSSASFPKKNYSIKIRDRNKKDKKVPLLSMQPNHKWVLHGPYVDQSMLRNHIAQEISKLTGQRALSSRYVEVYHFIGDKADFIGLYLLMEVIGIESLALNENPSSFIENENVFDRSFIFRLDPLDSNKFHFKTEFSQLDFSIFYPRVSDLSSHVAEQIPAKISDIEEKIFSDHDDDSIWDQLDRQSFIESLIVQDLAMDLDGLWKSQYLYKNTNGKLILGPVWDFNLAFNNYIFERSLGELNLVTDPQEGSILDRDVGIGSWTHRLAKSDKFRTQYTKRYRALRSEALSDSALSSLILSKKSLIREAQIRDFERWKLQVGDDTALESPEESVDRAVKQLLNFILDRARYLDDIYADPSN
ncbi:MAG: CotH kinase family protein [Pseudobacteriovorax sp.]|nr:CotH kinase family protein [Pseudobacteriovorax sp.]